MDNYKTYNDNESLERTARVMMPDNDSLSPASNDNSSSEESSQDMLALQQSTNGIFCPNCGSPVSEGADYCESCHHYINFGVCSFCGANLQGDEAYCPECGNPRGGIVCPRCNTMNEFAFCKQCGMPLTDEAKQLFLQVRQTPEYQHLQMIANQLCDLDKVVPMATEAEALHEEVNRALRERVLKLLAEDEGIVNSDIPDLPSKRMTMEEYKTKKHNLAEQLMEALEAMRTQPTEKPVEARNYAMAMKPAGLRLAWKCNYKHAIHSSPCGCAKPHLGGKWIILGQSSKPKIVNDNG